MNRRQFLLGASSVALAAAAIDRPVPVHFAFGETATARHPTQITISWYERRKSSYIPTIGSGMKESEWIRRVQTITADAPLWGLQVQQDPNKEIRFLQVETEHA